MNTRHRVPKWAVILTALCALVCGGILLICAGGVLVGFYIYDDLRLNPPRDFTRHTEIQWPQTATVVFTHDDHSLPLGDGESHIVFDADTNTLDKWLAGSPPWKVDKWQPGPIPDEITGHCRHDNAEVLRLLDSPDTQFVAEDLGPERLPWHNSGDRSDWGRCSSDDLPSGELAEAAIRSRLLG